MRNNAAFKEKYEKKLFKIYKKVVELLVKKEYDAFNETEILLK